MERQEKKLDGTKQFGLTFIGNPVLQEQFGGLDKALK